MFITRRDAVSITVATVTFILGILLGLSIPVAEPTYELIQIKDGNVYVLDYNQSLTDCEMQVRDNPKANLGCIKE